MDLVDQLASGLKICGKQRLGCTDKGSRALFLSFAGAGRALLTPGKEGCGMGAVVVNENEEAPGKARGHLSRNFNCTNF